MNAFDRPASDRAVQISHRARQLPASPIRKLVPLAEAAESRGIEVHRLNIGQPDFATPPEMLAAYQNFKDKVLAYGSTEGLPALRKAVAEYYSARGGPIGPEHVRVTVGGSEAIQFALSAIADPGDNVLVLEPYYANWDGFAAGAGVILRPVPTSAQDGFHLPKDEVLDAMAGSRTRGIISTSPSNPTGTIYTLEEMERLASFAKRHGLFLISDEVYREFAYDGRKVTSALSLPSIAEQVIVADSVSKRFSACGARVGFVISRNQEVCDAFTRMGHARLCPATVDQLAALAGYQVLDRFFDNLVDVYRARRDALVDALEKVTGVTCVRPEGAFYCMVTLPVEDTEHFASWLLSDFSWNNETVMLAPGRGFYVSPGRGHQEVRMTFLRPAPVLARCAQIIEAGIEAYKRAGYGD
jgi:aspartate aminotransferase